MRKRKPKNNSLDNYAPGKFNSKLNDVYEIKRN